MPEIVPALLGGVEVADGADGFPQFFDAVLRCSSSMQFFDGASADAPEMSLELGEGHFDRVEVGAVGRQEEE